MQTVGSQVTVKIVKNKHAPPFRTAQFELEFGKGISQEAEILELGCKHKFITKAGTAYYNLNGRSFCGKDAIKRFLAENQDAKDELIMKLREKLTDSERHKEIENETESTQENPTDNIISETTDEEVIAAAEV